MPQGPVARGPVVSVHIENHFWITASHLAVKVMHELYHLLVTPNNELFEDHGIEIHFPWYIQTSVGAEKLLTVGTMATRGERISLMSTPVGVIEIKTVNVEVVLEIAEIIGQPIPMGRIKAKPSQVFLLRPTIIEKLHQPLGMFRLEWLAVYNRIISENDDTFCVSLLYEPRQQIIFHIRVRSHHLRWEARGTTVVLAADDTNLKTDVADQINVILHREIGVGLSGVEDAGKVGFNAAHALFIWNRGQSFCGRSDALYVF